MQIKELLTTSTSPSKNFFQTSPYVLSSHSSPLGPHPIRLHFAEISYPDKSIYLQYIRDLMNVYPRHIVCFTDGNRTSYAYSINGEIVAHRVRNTASVFTAELMAILTQLSLKRYCILLVDSFSSLQLINDPFTSNPIVQRIHLTLSTLNSIRSTITFIWIPGHIGFLDHDAVDQAAKQAPSLISIIDKQYLPDTDYKSYYRSIITDHWKTYWKSQQPNKLLTIKKEPIPWTSSKRESRREEVIITRLRIGHTRLTHSYLIN